MDILMVPGDVFRRRHLLRWLVADGECGEEDLQLLVIIVDVCTMLLVVTTISESFDLKIFMRSVAVRMSVISFEVRRSCYRPRRKRLVTKDR